MSLHRDSSHQTGHTSDTDTNTNTNTNTDSDKLDKFKADVQNDADVTEEQRSLAASDMRFVNVPGGQWEDSFTDGTDNDERIRLEFDTVSDFLQSFLGEWAQNRVGVEFKPDDKGTTKDDSELINGIYRSDFRQRSGKLATDNAVDELATCGYGALKLATRFEDPGDPENENQVIIWVPIYSAFNVSIWDAAAKRPDKSDATRCTLLEQFTPESFARQWPDAIPVSAYDPRDVDFRSGSLTSARKQDTIYVATRYEVVKKPRKFWVYNNLKSGKIESYIEDDHDLIKDELKQDEFRKFVRIRTLKRPTVEKTIFSGEAILESTRRIAGQHIPIIPFYGYRGYVDNQEWWRGVVRKLKDPQRLYNTQISQVAENAATSGQEVPIFATEQMENPDVKAIWADKNNKSYLVADALRDKDGNIVATGPLGYSKPGALDQSTQALLEIVPNFMETLTGGPAQEGFRKDLSGKAIKALIQLSNRKTQVLNDHISLSIAWSGTVYASMSAEVHNRRRIVQTIARDGTESEALLMGVTVDEETGLSVESNDLRGKKFQSYADVGPQYETMREQTVEEVKGMLETMANTQGGERYVPVLLAILMDNIVGVGLEPLADLVHNVKLELGMIKPKTAEDKAFMENLQQQQQQPDPQQELLAAAADQQAAEARSLDASALQKTADASKKEAETAKIISELGLNRLKLFMEQQNTAIEQAQAGLGRPN